MKTIEVENLEPGSSFQKIAVHGSGEVLFPKNTEITIFDLGALNKVGISKLCLLDHDQEVETYKKNVVYTKQSIKEIKEGTTADRPIYNLKREQLLEAGETIDRETYRTFMNLDQEYVLVKKTEKQLKMDQVDQFRSLQKQMESDEEVKKELLQYVDTETLYKSEVDRRRHKRFPVNSPFEFSIVNEDGEVKNQAIPGRLQNISKSGVGVLTGEELEEGQLIYTDFSLPQIGEITGVLEVVWVDNESRNIFKFGAEFISVEGNEQVKRSKESE